MATYKKTDAAIARLSPEEYRVTQQSGTERPGTGALLHNDEAGTAHGPAAQQKIKQNHALASLYPDFVKVPRVAQQAQSW